MGLGAWSTDPLQEPIDRTQPCHVEEGQVSKIDDQRILQAEPVDLVTEECNADTIELTDEEQPLDAVPALEPNREEFLLRYQRAPLAPCLTSPNGEHWNRPVALGASMQQRRLGLLQPRGYHLAMIDPSGRILARSSA